MHLAVACCCCWLIYLAAPAGASAFAAWTTILARRVDDSNPYYSRVTVNASTDNSMGIADLASAMSAHFGGGIRMMVKNDLQVLLTDSDAADLTTNDRLEIWLLGSGVATRAETVAAFAWYGLEGELWRQQAIIQRERDRLKKLQGKKMEAISSLDTV